MKKNSQLSKDSFKVLKSHSVVKKNFKINPESILHEELYPKFGKRFLDYRKKYDDYLNKEKSEIVLEYPISVLLELVNRCNLECTFCYQGYRNDAQKYTLEIESLKKIFAEFKKYKLDALILSASEPLLFKDFDKVLKMAEDAKIMDQFLFTNGTLLNEKNSEKILNSSLTRLFISLDAATESTYDKVRIPVGKNKLNTNRLEALEKNIKNFMSMRKSQKKKLPLTRVSFIALDKNFHEIDTFISKWVDIVDSVEVQRESSIKIYDEIFKKKYNDKLVLKDYKCSQPWGQVSIYSDGIVTPCCSTVGRNIPIGNVLENGLKKIWDSGAMWKIRSGLLNNKPQKVCKLCLEYKKEFPNL